MTESIRTSTIAEHDKARAEFFTRSSDRPDTAFRAPRVKQTLEERRAKDRLRSAAYRVNLDNRRRPERNVVATALLEALVTSYSIEQLTSGEINVVSRMFQNLIARGFDRAEVEDVIRQFKKNLRESYF